MLLQRGEQKKEGVPSSRLSELSIGSLDGDENSPDVSTISSEKRKKL